MAEAGDNGGEEAIEAPARRNGVLRAARCIGYGIAGLVALLLALVVFLHTPPGRQLIIDQIAKFAPASGLSVEVGSIEGSVLWSATFNDVRLYDAEDDLFLEVPEIDLNWRPWRWFTSGLDVRHLVLSDGTLYKSPELLPGDPDAPILPDFDIRIDRLVIEDLHVAEGVLGAERVIQFRGQTDIRDGRVYADAGGEFGGGDVFTFTVEAEPDGDVFDLHLDWQAPEGGFLASMVGAEQELVVKLDGDGTWNSWQGKLDAVQGGEPLADVDIYNEAGQYRLVGSVHPGGYVEGTLAQALGEETAFTASGTLESSVLEGTLAVRGQGVDLDATGAVDLADNRFGNFLIEAQLLDSTLFGPDMVLEDASLSARLDGPFRELIAPIDLRIGRIAAGDFVIQGLTQRATARWDGTRLVLPLDVEVARVVSGVEMFDPRLVRGRIDGTLTYVNNRLLSDDLAIRFPEIAARLNLRGNLDTGRFQLAGPVRAENLALEGMGAIDTDARIDFAIGGGAPWSLSAQLSGRMDEVTNDTLANLAGDNIRFTGGIAMGETQALSFKDFQLTASKLELQVDGAVGENVTTLTGSGRHVDYGPFTVDASLEGDGPHAELVFADPLPAAGLRDVRVAFAPSDDGFAIETSGGSLLGPFDGLVDLRIADNGDTTIGITRLDISDTRLTGDLALVEGGVMGDLALARGGVDGTITLAPQGGGQGFDIDVTARDARFGGETPLTLARADIDASGTIGGTNGTTVMGRMTAQGVGYGNLFLGRMAANGQIANGSGTFDAAITGRRGSRFELVLSGDVAPERIALAAEGSYAGRDITMPRRAVLLKTADGGWELQRTQLTYGDGVAVLRGRFGGEQAAEGRVAFDDMPLGLIDAVAGDIGLGGKVSGVAEFTGGSNGLPTGNMRLLFDGLTRSGLLLTSEPIDLAVVADLSESLLQMRAAITDGGSVDGQLAGRIANLPLDGGLMQRLYAGDLFAQLRYAGPAAALWRLAAIDLIDINGPLELAANARGTLADPQVRGSLQGDDLRVQSALTGTDIRGVSARGRFDGPRLQLTRFSGQGPDGGTVSGSGFVDLSGMTRERGPQIDIRMAARGARILALPEMGATVTGPMRIVSNGVGGTIAGRLQVNEASWRLGTSEVVSELPDIAITEINLPADSAPLGRTAPPWRYLIDAKADRGIKVDGMGLDSEWSGDIILRGTTADPRIGGEARIVPRQGFYSFAGVRFDITRGRIDFDETAPPDPRIDLVAETDVNSLAVSVSVQGRASQPDIAFSSVPALPEEELLAQLLFGGSITDLSATDALQLGAAVASLRGGGGMDPINKLRSAIGLDRLRIVPADPALDRGTAVALGKNITRKFYAEIVTDGQGYNATSLEFRVTSWLSLLGAINTVGRRSVSAEYSRDY